MVLDWDAGEKHYQDNQQICLLPNGSKIILDGTTLKSINKFKINEHLQC